jgi:hypothetical protein
MTRMQRFYPLRWLAVALGLFGTQCLDSISDDCTKTLTCDDQPPPVLDRDCIWRYPGNPGSVWAGGPHYDRETQRWRWPDGTETQTQDFKCDIDGVGDAGIDASAGLDCRLDPALCDTPRVCDLATGQCVECLSTVECSGNVPVGDAGAANVCDPVRHECVQCLDATSCSGDTPICKTDEANSDRNECVECVNDGQCRGATPVCDEATNECTARCTTPQECSGEKPVCNVTKQLCVECLDNASCMGTSATQCNTTSNECVECTDDAPCRATGEVCDTTSNNCVQCREDLQCAGVDGAPICNTDTNLCVACLNDLQCTGLSSSRCNVVSHQCVGCTSDAQCEGGLLCNQAQGGVCVHCLDDSNCTLGANHTCETSQGNCVECLNNDACPTLDAARCVLVPTQNETQYTCDACKDNSECSGKSAGGLCRTIDGLCVDCLSNGDCSGNAALSKCSGGGACSVCVADGDCGAIMGKNACKTSEGCVECVNDTHCANNEDGTHCKVTAGGSADINTCVECNSNADCAGAGAALCQDNQCVPCVADADCAHLDTNGATAGGTLGVCDSGTCVECTGPKRTACAPNVCNSLTKVCALNRPEGGAGLCDACISDFECATDARCVQQSVGASSGFFCFPIQVNALCNTRGFAERPVGGTPTLDSASTAMCLQRDTSCPAYLNYRSGLACQDATDDAACGVQGSCAASPGGFNCTISCTSAADCASGDCLEGGFCEL